MAEDTSASFYLLRRGAHGRALSSPSVMRSLLVFLFACWAYIAIVVAADLYKVLGGQELATCPSDVSR